MCAGHLNSDPTGVLGAASHQSLSQEGRETRNKAGKAGEHVWGANTRGASSTLIPEKKGYIPLGGREGAPRIGLHNRLRRGSSRMLDLH